MLWFQKQLTTDYCEHRESIGGCRSIRHPTSDVIIYFVVVVLHVHGCLGFVVTSLMQSTQMGASMIAGKGSIRLTTPINAFSFPFFSFFVVVHFCVISFDWQSVRVCVFLQTKKNEIRNGRKRKNRQVKLSSVHSRWITIIYNMISST